MQGSHLRCWIPGSNPYQLLKMRGFPCPTTLGSGLPFMPRQLLSLSAYWSCHKGTGYLTGNVPAEVKGPSVQDAILGREHTAIFPTFPCKSIGLQTTVLCKRVDDAGGAWGGSVGWAAHFGSGHDLAVCGFEPHVGLCADSLEPGACFRFCVSLSL